MTRKRSIRPGFEQRLLANLRTCALDGDRVTVGFSGGPDSLALAAALRRIAPMLDLHILLAHIDHRLRPSSLLDAQRCRQLAADLGLPIEIGALEPEMGSRARGLGIEEQGRRERYRAIANIATAWQSNVILTGHQANDQVETVLLHLFRGTGLRGLSGMRMHEVRSIPWWLPADQQALTFRLVRPLLDESRRTIERYLDEIGLQPILDESNASTDFDRNLVRHQILPRIQERWPAIVETLGRSIEAIQLDSEYLENLAADAERVAIPGDRTLCTDALLGLDRSIAYRVLRRWLLRIGVDDASFETVERVYTLATSANEHVTVEAGSGVTLVVAAGKLTTLENLLEEAALDLPLDVAGNNSRWSIELGNDLLEPQAAFFVPSAVAPTIRSLRAGDRWHGTYRLVFDDLRAAGIHPLVRPHLLAIASNDGILFIPAIYPTVRTELHETGMTETGIRWWKQV